MTEPKGKTELRKIVYAVFVTSGVMVDDGIGSAAEWNAALRGLKQLFHRGDKMDESDTAVHGKVKGVYFREWNLDEFGSVDSATDYLWDHGARP